jgi:hypothetical protein
MLFSLKITFCFDVYTLSHFAMQIVQSRAKGERAWKRQYIERPHPNLETRARNPLWRLAEALGNTGDFCMKISTFGSSTPLDIYK